MVNIKINGTPVTAQEGDTILSAAEQAGIHIPTLCHLKDVCADGLCRICVVKVAGNPRLQTACNSFVSEGMEIKTEAPEVLESRCMTLDLICKNHRMECEYCSRYMDCELHALLVENGMDDRIYASSWLDAREDTTSPLFLRDHAKCVQCRRCEAICAKQQVHAIGALGRASGTVIGASVPLPETGCINCGQCVAVCPTGALSFKSDVQKIWNLMRIGKKQMLALVVPEMLPALGKFMHLEEEAEGRLASFLRAMGFQKVYAMPKVTPVKTESFSISNACPAAVIFIKNNYPEYAEAILSGTRLTERAAQKCRDAYCAKSSAAAEDTALVLITPCAAEKGQDSGFDAVLTGRDLITFLNQGSVSKYTMLKLWRELEPVPLDQLETTQEISTAVLSADGLDALKALLKEVPPAAYIEAYACRGGCANGGGRLQ